MLTTMKKTLITLALIMMGFATQMFGMSLSTVRTHARFLSDRMAYELDLSPMQYDDCYEINYDFIYAINRIMDDVVYGYRDAIVMYYDLLDARNEDMRYVLNTRQFAKFMKADYFYRPVYSTGKKWQFRIYTTYSNTKFFYYDAPTGYKTYKGGHSNSNFYVKHYTHEIQKQSAKIKGSQNAMDHGRNDFGTIRRDRNDKKQNSINNYSNPNQPNRTKDERYQDKSGNKNSPQINNRQGTTVKPNNNQTSRNGRR